MNPTPQWDRLRPLAGLQPSPPVITDAKPSPEPQKAGFLPLLAIALMGWAIIILGFAAGDAYLTYIEGCFSR